MSNNTKKRRADASSDGEDNNGFLVHEELKALRSHMTNMTQTLLDSNRTQMAMISSMKGEISRLTEKCDRMEKSIDTMQRTQYKNYNTTNKMNQTMEATQNTISENQKYHEVLLRNQKWKYSAPRPSRGYWDGLDGDEDDAAEEFLKKIKLKTEEVRYGTGDGDIILIDADLPYNEEFLPHWKEFANALEQYQYRLKCLPKDTDSTLCLADMELPDAVLDLLSKALGSTNFTSFGLKNNNLGQSGIDFALKYLKDNQILKEFGLCRNTINNTKDIKQLCEIVEEHPSIESLYLEGCRGEGVDGYEMLQMIMSAGKYKLNSICLISENISTGGATFISDFLTDNLILECLDLSGNALDDNDARAIAGALEHNENLRRLDVRNNNISRVGWAALRKAEFDDTSLNSAADSNHTCLMTYPVLEGLDTNEMNGDPENSVPFRPMYVRHKKIYSILSSRNRQCSNVGHFDDIPVEFLPEMIRTFQQYSNYHVSERTPRQDSRDVNPLSIVYEVCRYWDKSLAVYELLSS